MRRDSGIYCLSKFWKNVVFLVVSLMVLYVSSLISPRFSRVRKCFWIDVSRVEVRSLWIWRNLERSEIESLHRL